MKQMNLSLTESCDEDFDMAAADKHSPWLPQPPVPDTEASDSRGVPDIEAHKREAKKRKEQPLYSGCFAYFPDALLAVAELSFAGNKWHNPGQPLHWDRKKSTDQHDALLRHLIDAGTIDTDGIRHSAKVAWRALAALQLEIERG